MFFRVFFYFLLIHFVITSNSDQEDLSISNYYHIGCLTLDPDKQFITNDLQENSLLPHQTFSSPSLTIDLCFRLCRRWIILTNNDHTNCICLYTLNNLYEIKELLGEVLPTANCTTNALQIYSLTEDPYILPLPTPIDDWSFEGCYRLDGLQAKKADTSLTSMNYTSALNECRKYCQTTRNKTDFPFFLSFKKFCYCLPVNIKSLVNVTMTAIRKPLIHCSFLLYVKTGFNNSFNESSVNVDTMVKIYVQRYCSSPFIFDRKFHRCFQIISLNKSNSYSEITLNHSCSSMSVTTKEEYNHLVSLLPSPPSRTFIWINRNSTYLFDNLFKSKNNSLLSEDLCLAINRTQSSSSSSDLVSCSTVQSSDYVFCVQKPIAIINSPEFTSIEPTPILNNIMCPTGFILFDNLCYHVDISFVNDIRTGEQLCSDNYQNSSLVKFDSHQLGNANASRIVGRAFDDILLEFLYYQVEKKLNMETKTSKDWLRLLVGDKNDENRCVLRYFTRSTGAFNISSSCDQGGHPICQSQPLLILVAKTNRWRIKFIIVSVSTLITLIGIIFLIYYFRRDRVMQLTRVLRERINPQRKVLSSIGTTNETFDIPDTSYIQLETCPESIPMDKSTSNSLEHMYTPIDDPMTFPEPIPADDNENDNYCVALISQDE